MKLEKVAKTDFSKIKEILCFPKLVIHYDPKKPLVLCGMSPYGLGVVLSHTLLGGSEKHDSLFISSTIIFLKELLSNREREVSDNICS